MAQSFLDRPGLPLGLRNNNPGNLRPLAGGQKWQGEIDRDYYYNFSRFSDVGYGLRAMITDITGDIVLDGMNTVTKLITAYAPPSENDTQAYINYVCNATGFGPHQVIQPTRANIEKLIRAKMKVELGNTYAAMITQSDINAGFDRLSNQAIAWIHGGLVGPGMAAGGAVVAAGLLGFAIYLLATTPGGKQYRARKRA